MFTKLFKSVLLMLTLVSALMITSCEKEESANISEESAKKSAQIDAANDEVDGIIEEIYVSEEGLLGKSASELSALPSCMTRTVVQSGLTRTVTLNFGTGCDMPNGNHLSGIIVMVYQRDPVALSRTITFSYNSFTFNGIALSGGGNIVRLLANNNGFPQSTATVDVTAIFPDNASVHRTGTKVREWFIGFNNGDWTDNQFRVTGNWTTEFSNGDVNSGLVTTPLIRKATCRFFVSGILQLSHNDFVGTLDFGDGSCDNVAIFTGPNGVQHTVHLGH